MTVLDSLKQFVEQRLASAVEEIFEYFQKTITDYEEELDRYRKMLDIVLLPEIRLRREDVPSLTVNAKISPEQQGIRPSEWQEDPPPPHIKEEQDKVRTSQEGRLKADILGLPFPPISVKSEDDEENPQVSQLCQSQTEQKKEAAPVAKRPDDQMESSSDGEDCEVAEPTSDVQAPSDNSSLDCSGPEIKDNEDLNRFNDGKMCEPFSCLFCERQFCSKSELVIHKRGHTRQKPYCRTLQQSSNLKSHLKVHTAEMSFRCSDCGECFSHHVAFKQHMMQHGGQMSHSEVTDENT